MKYAHFFQNVPGMIAQNGLGECDDVDFAMTCRINGQVMM
jgi:CRISPR/Cas system CMR-associated protein Cmr5 small subunit